MKKLELLLVVASLFAAGALLAPGSLCETNDARIAFGIDAVKGASPVGHVLAAGTSMRIPSYKMFIAAKIISKTADSPALLQVSLEY
jgi:hypothetical protein